MHLKEGFKVKKVQKEVLSLLIKRKDSKDVVEAVKRAKSGIEIAFALIENECFEILDRTFSSDDIMKYWAIWSAHGYSKVKRQLEDRIYELELQTARLEEEIANMTK